MPVQTPEFISLRDAVFLTGRNESTIRRFFKKPENKHQIQTKGGKVYINKAVLLKQYRAPEQTPESPEQTPGTTPESPEQTPELHNGAINAAMQALVNQLEAKDRQIAALNERLKESNINLNVAMQKLQLQQYDFKEEQEQEQKVTSEQAPQPEQKPRSWFKRLFSSNTPT
jgi:hypothetical protein